MNSRRDPRIHLQRSTRTRWRHWRFRTCVSHQHQKRRALVTTHKACLGLLRRSVILRRACHSESSAAADIPEEPSVRFFTEQIVRPTFSNTSGHFTETVREPVCELFCKAGCSLRCVKLRSAIAPPLASFTYSCETNSKLFAAMHNNTLIWLVEDVGEPRADVVEQTDRISKEISRSENSVQLRDDLFLVMKHKSFL
jgi:hypothetical protein